MSFKLKGLCIENNKIYLLLGDNILPGEQFDVMIDIDTLKDDNNIQYYDYTKKM